ncbi:MAG: A/G-specific adenine glycosylase [Bacteroidales bacterium]|jgi:A/G-specific adenine glycosylase|nr:A/G-specific adenine glycosylase [Bacteroidales bacterium]
MIGQKLIAWYEINKRNLPWRDTGYPYLIWVSEVILQQTRVVQGLDYYHRFIDAYPDIFSLARADIDELLKIWQGLGYYSRARNMHAAAKHIVDVYDGKFPATYNGLITIKGIGDYTASAIASIAFGQAVPVIDGNVNRVIARLYGVQQPVNKPAGQKKIRIYAEKLMVRDIPGIYNQAIMEFGALQCIPQNPNCNGCILNRVCVAYRGGLVNMLPIKEKTAKIVTRYFHYLHVRFGNRTFIRRRADGDIWTGLYEFPMIETSGEIGPDDLTRIPAWQSYFDEQTPLVEAVSGEITRRLTHRILKIRFYEIVVDKPVSGQNLIEIPATDICRYAVPKVIDNYLKHIETQDT